MQYKTSLVASLLASLVAALSFESAFASRATAGSSDLATLYLVASILLDAILLKMPSENPTHTEILRPILVRCLVHLALLILECRGKRPVFSILDESQSPEELNSTLSKVFFGWINPILLQGYRNILVDQDLPPLSRDIRPEVSRKAILQAWSQPG